jgi:hypothetical protein
MNISLYKLRYYCDLNRVLSSLAQVDFEKSAGLEKIRLIYYWDKKTESFYMLLIYSKSKKDDLSQDQLRILNQLIKEELK